MYEGPELFPLIVQYHVWRTGRSDWSMEPSTVSNNNASRVRRGRIVLAKHSLFDPHYGMFLSLLYILIVKYTELIFQFSAGECAECRV